MWEHLLVMYSIVWAAGLIFLDQMDKEKTENITKVLTLTPKTELLILCMYISDEHKPTEFCLDTL